MHAHTRQQGQELTARSHFQGIIRKRLMPVYLSPAGDSEEESVPSVERHARLGASMFADTRLDPTAATVPHARAHLYAVAVASAMQATQAH